MKSRQSNFELLRIVCMLFIVMVHAMMMHKTQAGGDLFLYNYVRPFFYIAVNTFVLISGYFGMKFRAERVFALVAQTFFYCILGLGFLSLIGYHSFSLSKDYRIFIPIFSKQCWFITVYIALCCLAPFCNAFIERITKKEFSKFLLVGFILLYVWPTISVLLACRPLVGGAGFSLVNFVYLYFWGRYIKLYYQDNKSSLFYLLGYFVCCGLVGPFQSLLSNRSTVYIEGFLNYDTVFMLGGATCLFLAFKQFQFQSKLVNWLATPCLAVYLWHCGPWEMCIYLHEITGIDTTTGFQYLLYVLCSGFVVYAIGILIEKIRLLLFSKFEKWVINQKPHLASPKGRNLG